MIEFHRQFDRRTFIAGAGATAFALVLPVLPAEPASIQDCIIVSPNGADDAPGSLAHPLRSLDRALALSRSIGRSTILLRAGTYELTQPLHIKAANAPLRIANYAHEEAILSGGTRLQLAWRPYPGRDLPSHRSDQAPPLTSSSSTIGARFWRAIPTSIQMPGISTASPPMLSAPNVLRAGRILRVGISTLYNTRCGAACTIASPEKMRINTLHYEGGWQINSGNQPMHKEYLFVENIFEELDAPGEWFLNEQTSTLYFYPPAGLDLDTATVDIVRLTNLVTIGDASSTHVRNLTLAGLTFRHTLRTFMETREPLLRSDWRIYRGGAIYVEGAEDAVIENCFFDQLGGNAIFMSGYNRRVHVRGCRIEECRCERRVLRGSARGRAKRRYLASKALIRHNRSHARALQRSLRKRLLR